LGLTNCFVYCGTTVQKLLIQGRVLGKTTELTFCASEKTVAELEF